MNTINLNEYMNSVYSEWNSSNEPILAALGKKGAPRIDFGNRIYGAKGMKSLSKDFRHFKCSQLRECHASLTVLYGEDGEIIMPIQIKNKIVYLTKLNGLLYLFLNFFKYFSLKFLSLIMEQPLHSGNISH
jgi:hypothetical protein